MNISELKSPHVKTGGICYFARMVDKIRFNEKGALSKDYLPNLGGGFDKRCVDFLWIEYPALVAQVKKGGTDDELLEWAFSQGRKPGEEEIEVWNEFMRKRGWNDEATERLQQRKAESGFPNRANIETFFDYIDMDEGRDPAEKSA